MKRLSPLFRMLMDGAAVLAAVAAVSQQSASPPALPGSLIAPAVINSTYVIGDSISGLRTIHLYEEDGRLTMDEVTKLLGKISESVKYENVNYVAAEENALNHHRKTTVRIEASDGHLIILLRTELEAKAVADYVGRKCSLELIGDAWQVRRHFQCPNGAGDAACQSFTELLDHDDPDIVRFYYSREIDERRYVCLSEDSARFFLIFSTRSGRFGWFGHEVFEDGQSTNDDLAQITWLGDYGKISTVEEVAKKPKALGTVDPSSLFYEAKFTNKMGTTTEYALRVRWSTGRYTESLSGKDEKGKPFYSDMSGTCTKLN